MSVEIIINKLVNLVLSWSWEMFYVMEANRIITLLGVYLLQIEASI